MNTPLLETVNLAKNFGALHAVDNASVSFDEGEVHAIIGPNGAGKTTFINLLSGELAPSNGSIRFKQHDITHLSPDKISLLGIGRSYQKTNIFPQYTCYENCWLGAQSRLPSSMRFFRAAQKHLEVCQRTEKALAMSGLSERSHTIAAEMSYGEQRQLEIGMMLATEPELLLLDEPLAGMGAEEARSVIQLLKDLAQDHTLILIEHDMDAVFAIADMLTVMVNGQVLETGAPETIRSSQAVRDAYLGDDD